LHDTFPTLEKTVFIVTYGRSGSTLVQNMLNALPGACVRGENENLLAPLARDWAVLVHSAQAAKMRATAKRSLPSDPWYGYEAISADAFGQALAHAFLSTVLRPGPDTRIIGFKEIRWHHDPALFPVMLDFLRKFFPNPHFVFNLRDHDAVCRSGWWQDVAPAVVKRTLHEAEQLYAAYSARNPEFCLTLRYDDYVQRPVAWKALFDFLGESFDQDKVDAVMNEKLRHLQPNREADPPRDA